MKINLHWRGLVKFEAQSGSGHRLMIDGPPQYGGENAGARPMETFLAGAAACSAFDVVHILQKGKRQLTSLTVAVEGERAEQEPKVFTHIHLHFVGSGDQLKENALMRAVQLSVEKYCSALRMLAASCEITHSCEIRAAD